MAQAEMVDVVGRLFSADHIRDWTIAANIAAAFFIGPYLAFAGTPDAGFWCPQAFLRMLHRIVLCLFSIALMYNATLIFESDRVPIGSAFLINVGILLSTLLSAVRYMWMPSISKDATWSNPHFPLLSTDQEASDNAKERHRAAAAHRQ